MERVARTGTTQGRRAVNGSHKTKQNKTKQVGQRSGNPFLPMVQAEGERGHLEEEHDDEATNKRRKKKKRRIGAAMKQAGGGTR
eukprot:CAMPEP_0206577794 /NCGR_PEP_ID=MMETSP0325_2-20121206/31578_1 /ASSEMBLY_ACC=CAM_ASM_000347 /TAXON_ID=2866 /ORGANISM="Crypthecodinium cohnii, Strain Seligo" /LENGTH=83 /DNA_ID=CAMNT_0054083307 /DNA_START=258 /DNA_END=509 /DNA_ORIENTATION=+